MKQLMELTVLQIKGRLLVEIRSPGETESLSLCHLRHLWSCWLQLLIWNARKHLVCIFSSPLLSVSFIKVLLKAVRDKETFHFREGGGISRGFLHVTMTDGKCFQEKSAQVAAKYFMYKCTWQTQGKKIPWPPSWELPVFIPLQAYHISLYFENVSWQAQVSQFDQHRVHLGPTSSWLQTSTDCQSWFPSSIPSPADTWKYVEVYIICNRFVFLLFISWNMV